jgi:hypothetical protein
MWNARLAKLVFVTTMLSAAGAAAAPCAPPSGFVDTPPPPVAATERLVSHTEELIIERPLAAVLDALRQTELEDVIDRSSPLPGVAGTHVLTNGEFGAPGSRRIVCLTNGSTLVEQVLANDDRGVARFRYVVWNYTTPEARPIRYGVGHFVRTDLGNGRTHVRWTYSFELEPDEFPGYLGCFGRLLFRVGFLDRQYAEMMRGTLAGEKVRIENRVPVPFVAEEPKRSGR